MSDIHPACAASFARQGLMTTFGATLLEASGGRARIKAPVSSGVSQQQGFGHAGLTFAIADSAGGYAALSLLPEGQEVLTAEMKINLLAPARGSWLVATGRVVKPGRRLIVVTAEVADAEDRAVAVLQGTMVPVER